IVLAVGCPEKHDDVARLAGCEQHGTPKCGAGVESRTRRFKESFGAQTNRMHQIAVASNELFTIRGKTHDRFTDPRERNARSEIISEEVVCEHRAGLRIASCEDLMSSVFALSSERPLHVTRQNELAVRAAGVL